MVGVEHPCFDRAVREMCRAVHPFEAFAIAHVEADPAPALPQPIITSAPSHSRIHSLDVTCRDGLENRAHSFEDGLRLATAGVDITRERTLPAILG
jgi:hypothetical protein